jgi:hypothetical protein
MDVWWRPLILYGSGGVEAVRAEVAILSDRGLLK